MSRGKLSQAVGKTTKRVVTRSRSVGRNPFEGRSVTERTEETPLLNEDEARRLDLDEVILVVDAQMPIRARRIKYYEDPALKVIHAGQQGDHPYPDAEKRQYDARLKEAEEAVERLSRGLQAISHPQVGSEPNGGLPAQSTNPSASTLPKSMRKGKTRTPPVPLEIDFGALPGLEYERQAVEMAVLKTTGILQEHAE